MAERTQGELLRTAISIFWPKPPLWRPGHSESGRNSRLCITMGEMLSITSAGAPLMPLGKAVAESSSPPLRAHAAAGEEHVHEEFAVLALAGDLGVQQA